MHANPQILIISVTNIQTTHRVGFERRIYSRRFTNELLLFFTFVGRLVCNRYQKKTREQDSHP